MFQLHTSNLVSLYSKIIDIRAERKEWVELIYTCTQFKTLFSVWLDARTASTVEAILKETPGQNKDYIKDLCGLPISTYFSALKLRWLLDNVPEVQDTAAKGNLLFGTVDSWLLWVSENVD